MLVCSKAKSFAESNAQNLDPRSQHTVLSLRWVPRPIEVPSLGLYTIEL
jgi:hypothetical protein